MQARKLKTNHLRNPIGIDYSVPRLTWVCQGGERQTAWRVVAVDRHGETAWDSGKTAGQEMVALWSGAPLCSRARIKWRVMLWDENDLPDEWSEEASFELGLLDAQDWEAQWIDPEEEINAKKRQPASYLKKTFSLDNAPELARMYATAHGIYNVWLNGVPVDGYFLAPGSSQIPRRLQVQTYDVTKLLREGENTLLVTLGDGWYRGSVDYGMNLNSFGKDIALLLQLEVDGRLAAVSDESWLASQNGPLGLNDPMIGEEYDARKEAISDWHHVTVRSYGFDNLIGTDSVPVSLRERFAAKLFTAPNGDQVLDFGQNIAGGVTFSLEAKAGQRLVLTHGETLDENGNFTIKNFQNPGKPNCKQQIIYTCKDGLNEYRATKCYFGFRYVKVEANFPIAPASFTATAVYSDMEQTGFFSCGNSLVNQLFKNAVWSMKGNFVDMPTDCPTREKSGYSGDAQIFSQTAIYLMDAWPVLARWIAEQAATQAEDGCISQIAPYNGRRIPMDGGTGWCDSLEIVPWRLYKSYDDPSLFERYYEQIKAFMLFQINRQKKTRRRNRKLLSRELWPYFADQGVHWGEWNEPGIFGKEHTKYMIRIFTQGSPESATAFMSYGCGILSRMAEKLGKSEDAEYFSLVSSKAKEAYRAVSAPGGHIPETDRQCLYVRPLALGLLEESEKQEAADALARAIRRNGNRLNTGFLSTPELCRVLTENGHADTAYDLLLQEERPGWLYSVKRGATTILESWDGIDENGKPSSSHNHYSYGAIAGWLIDCVCGIRVENGAITIRPFPDRRLDHAEAEYRSPLGTIRSSWRYEEDGLHVEAEIPANTTAEIILPDGQKQLVSPGSHSFVI